MNWVYEPGFPMKHWHCKAGKYWLNVTEAAGTVSWWIQDRDGRNYGKGTAESPVLGQRAAYQAFLLLPGAEEALAKLRAAAPVGRPAERQDQPICPHCGQHHDAAGVQIGEVSEQPCDACGKWFEIIPQVVYITKPITKS